MDPKAQQEPQGRSGAVAATGGRMNYYFYVADLALAWFGWFITMCGLSAAQHYVKKRNQDEDAVVSDVVLGPDPDFYKLLANYPVISAGKLFRFDWFVLFLEFTVLCVVSIGTASALLRQVRISLIGFLSVATMLIIVSTDRLYNMSGQLPNGATAARVAFAGYLLMAIGNFGCMYLLGLDPDRAY